MSTTAPADRCIVFLTAADTELLTLAAAVRRLPAGFAPVRAESVLRLSDPAALDAFLADIAGRAGVVVARVLGGRGYFRDGFDRLHTLAVSRRIPLICLPGDRQADPELTALCTAPLRAVHQTFAYLSRGGVDNAVQMLLFLSDTLLMTGLGYEEPAELPADGVYSDPQFRPQQSDPSPQRVEGEAAATAPRVGVLFYRAHWMSGNTAFVDALCDEIRRRAAEPLPVFCYSLKETDADGTPAVFRKYLLDEHGRCRVDVLINTMSFSAAAPGDPGGTLANPAAFGRLGVPVLQAVLSGGTEAEWLEGTAGLSPRDTAMNVAIPEFDGRIITTAISFKSAAGRDERLGCETVAYAPRADRVAAAVDQALRWARLSRKPRADRKIAVLFGNYPTKNARIGNGVGLDTPASVMSILAALRDAGYTVGPLPESGDALLHKLIDTCTHDAEFLTDDQLARAADFVDPATYARWFDELPPAVREQMTRQWGPPPGRYMVYRGAIAVPGLTFGNVFVGIQPARGYGQDSSAIYHSPDLPPTHYYLAFYRRLRDVFGADAVMHVGKHGNLEWLPGKSLATSASCWPEVMLDGLPNVYPYIINNPGEGAQAKRRAHAVVVDHMIPPMTRAETYGDLLKLEQLCDEYSTVQSLDPAKAPILRARILELVERSRIYRDLGMQHAPGEDSLDTLLQEIDGYLCEIKESQIRGGLHVFGKLPEGEALVDLLVALVRLDNGDNPGLHRAIAEDLGLAYDALRKDPGAPAPPNLPAAIAAALPDQPVRTCGDVIERLELLAKRHVTELVRDWTGGPASIAPPPPSAKPARGRRTAVALEFLAGYVWPRVRRIPDEIASTLTALDGKFVEPGGSGAPTRGMVNILPTGRNFYSVDIRTIPSETAWQVGRAAAEQLLARYKQQTGEYPRSVGIVVWGTSNMRTQGDDIAEILCLLGVKPTWQGENRRLTGIDVIPLSDLGRPRIDVTVRISGFFRDAFPNVVHLIDEAVERVANLDEPAESNFVRAAVLRDRRQLTAAGMDAEQAGRRARRRIFGSKPGSYGAGLLNLIDERNWKTDADLAEVYVNWGGYAYTRVEDGVEAKDDFKRRLAGISVAVQNQDNREHDIFDSDDYFQFHGGMIAAIRSLTGKNPTAYFGDTSKPDLVRVRDLTEEVHRVFRARVVNPKWIASAMKHGYKGGFEMAATIDYMFGYDAAAEVLEDWMYEKVTQAYLLDEAARKFLEEHNPWALRSMAERLIEATQRGLWEAPAPETMEALQSLYMANEAALEKRG